jgi:hypothetical protein
MIGYLVVWVIFAAFLVLFGLLVLIQLVRQGLARLRRPPPDERSPPDAQA